MALVFCLCLILFNATTLFKTKQKVAQAIVKGRAARQLQRDLGSLDMLLKLRNNIDLKGIEKHIPEISSANLGRISDVKSLRIFVYPLPSKFNIDLLKMDVGGLCTSGAYSTDYMLHMWLLSSEYITTDPKEADYFYVPLYGACSFSVNRNNLLYEKVLSFVVHNYPYFNQTQGKDHIWTFAFSGHSVFRGAEKIQRGILLTHRGRGKDYIPYKDIVIPPNLEFLANRSSSVSMVHAFPPRKMKRKLFLFYSLYSEYAKDVVSVNRHVVSVGHVKKCFPGPQKDLKFSSVNSTKQLLREVPSATFCICMESQPDFYNCLTIAVLFNCVPTIIGQQNIGLPFDEAINYGSFSIQVPAHRLCTLRAIVQNINESILQSMLNEISRVRRVFMYRKGHAGDVLIRLLAKRRPLVTNHNPYVIASA